MKILAALAFLLASVIAAPAPCAHAMGLGEANETLTAEEDTHQHHAMDHSLPEAGHHDTAANHQDHGCADGCDGGAGCESCAITNAAISTTAEFSRHFASYDALPAIFAAGVDKPTSLDPPPPRA